MSTLNSASRVREQAPPKWSPAGWDLFWHLSQQLDVIARREGAAHARQAARELLMGLSLWLSHHSSFRESHKLAQLLADALFLHVVHVDEAQPCHICRSQDEQLWNAANS